MLEANSTRPKHRPDVEREEEVVRKRTVEGMCSTRIIHRPSWGQEETPGREERLRLECPIFWVHPLCKYGFEL